MIQYIHTVTYLHMYNIKCLPTCTSVQTYTQTQNHKKYIQTNTSIHANKRASLHGCIYSHINMWTYTHITFLQKKNTENNIQYRSINGLMERQNDRQKDRWVDRQMDCWMGQHIDGLMDGQIDRLIEIWIQLRTRIDKQISRHIDRYIDRRTLYPLVN